VKIFQTAALFLALTGVAQAHDSWLEPKSFQVKAGDRVPVTFFVGHHGEQRSVNLSVRPQWLLSVRAAGPHRSTDLLKQRAFNPAAGIVLAGRGTYVLSLDTGDFDNQMTAKEFEQYLDEEGLALAEDHWRRTPISGRKIRESYRRHAKSLITSGTGAAALAGPVTRRVGQRLEIVPAVNPYRLRPGERIQAAVWYRERPLMGAEVHLHSMDRPKDAPVKARSDAKGTVGFNIPTSGRWMMNVVWSEPTAAARADYQTSFSSMTFAVR
jgi:hypothetical protein